MDFSIFNLTNENGRTKIQHLVHSITGAINSGKLKDGDFLPSINQLSSETGFSRDTVFKAYNILKKRNIIESAPTKGYFVTGESPKVLMLLDDFSAFKEQLYQSFRQNLPKNYSVDLLFHHYNPDVFHQLVQNSLGRYSIFIVMNLDNKAVDPVLDRIDPNKLLILDMGNPNQSNFNFLLQDFNKAVFNCLSAGLEKIRKYRKLFLIYSEKTTPHPAETVSAVKNFCKKHNMDYRKTSQIEDAEVEKGTIWFTIRDSDLVKVIKVCKQKDLIVGNDVGVISYNDTPMKQIVGGGITVISTDFELMGQNAAEFVKNKQKIAKILPTSLILRASV